MPRRCTFAAESLLLGQGCRVLLVQWGACCRAFSPHENVYPLGGTYGAAYNDAGPLALHRIGCMPRATRTRPRMRAWQGQRPDGIIADGVAIGYDAPTCSRAEGPMQVMVKTR